MTWQELTEEIALAVWKIECADMMIPAEDAERKWNALNRFGSSHRVVVTHTVGCALIALKDRGLIQYE
jgi:hypothetical protein